MWYIGEAVNAGLGGIRNAGEGAALFGVRSGQRTKNEASLAPSSTSCESVLVRLRGGSSAMSSPRARNPSAWQVDSHEFLTEPESFGIDRERTIAPASGVGGAGAAWMKVF